MCSTMAGWNVLYMSARSILSIVLFELTISLLIFYPDDLPFVDSGVLKPLTFMMLLYISPSSSVGTCFIHLDVPMLGA